MPKRFNVRAMKFTSKGGFREGKSGTWNQKGKSGTSKGKPKGKHYVGSKGHGKHGGETKGKDRWMRRPSSPGSQRVSPVSKHDQPAFQTNLAMKTSRKRLADNVPGSSSKRTRTVPVAMPMAGMPVPPAKYFGNSERMRLHEMKSSPINLETGNFDIHKRTVCIKGRPVQCLQVSHQKARSFEFDGCIPFLMRPVPVQAIQGYSSFDPDRPFASHPYEVVGNWWQVLVFLVSLDNQGWF